MTLPNLITIGRLLLVPLIIWFIVADEPLAAFIVLLVAGISDGVDGFIARNFDLRSDLGTYLDPVADKALLVSVYVTLAIVAAIPVWLTILIVSRDVLIVGAVVLSWMLSAPTGVRPLAISKVNTVAQIILAVAVLGSLGFDFNLGWLQPVLVYAVAVLTVASAAMYLVDWIRHMGTTEAASSPPSGDGARKTPS
ncbi:MAG TPA: CDP-alcohol phosphatidyltransferase family protein [Bauldia sp.]|nr:CDP-alcohol phosphatidyltransferase family protein [Bauldia sp.]